MGSPLNIRLECHCMSDLSSESTAIVILKLLSDVKRNAGYKNFLNNCWHLFRHNV